MPPCTFPCRLGGGFHHCHGHGHFRWTHLCLSRPSVRHAWPLAFTLAKHLLHSYSILVNLANPQQCSTVTTAHLVFFSCHRHLGGGGGVFVVPSNEAQPDRSNWQGSLFIFSYFGRFLTLLLFLTGQNKIKIVYRYPLFLIREYGSM